MNVRNQLSSLRWLGWAVVIVSATIYISTSCRTVYVGDSGELSLILKSGGIAHPPGYPLYTILGYFWLKLLFFLRPAFAANLFSAAVAAAGAGLLFRLLERIGRPHLPPLIAAATALLYALAHPVWFSAVHAEVYALTGLLVIATLYASITYYFEGRLQHLVISAFLCGLILTHHFSAVVVMAAPALIILLRHRATISPRSLMAAGLAFMLPLTLYLYLLLRFDPALPINWLAERSIGALWSVVSGENYRQFVGIATPGDVIEVAQQLTLESLLYFGPGLVLLSIPGLIGLFRRDIKLGIALVAPVILNLYIVACYHIPDYEGYLMPLLIITTIFIACGISWLYSIRTVPTWASYVLAVILIGFPLTTNYATCTLSGFRLAERYGRDLLDSATPGSSLMLKSDNGSHTALYLRYGEDYRSDVEVFSSHCTLTRMAHTFGMDRSAPVLDSLVSRGDVLFWGIEYIVNQGMNPSPGEKQMRGMLYGPPEIPADPELDRRLDRFAVDRLPSIDLNDDTKARHIYLEYRLRYIDRLLMSGNQSLAIDPAKRLYRWGQALDHPRTCLAVAQFYLARGLIEESLRWVDLARETGPMSYEEKDIYVNLGAIYRRSGSLDLAYKSLARALDIDRDYQPARHNFTLVKAEMAVRQQDWSAAIEAFSTLARLEPENPLPYFNIAVIYERMPGHEPDAISMYHKFIMMAGDDHAQAVERAQNRILALDSTFADSQ